MWTVSRDEIARPLGFHDSVTTAVNGANALTDTTLTPYFSVNDALNGWWVLIEAGDNAAKVRRATDYVASTGVITTSNPALSLDVTAARAYSLYRFSPVRMVEHYNRARRLLYPHLSIVRDLATIMTGSRQYRYQVPGSIRNQPLYLYLGNRDAAVSMAENVLTNPGFETWTVSTTPDNWVLSGAGSTVSQEKATTAPRNYAVLGDNSSAKIVVTTNLTTLLESVDLSASGKVASEGMEVNLGILVYCLTASRVRAQISGAGVAATVNSAYHTGLGWERLTVTANLISTATTFDVGIAITASTAIAVYVDEALGTVGQSEVADREWDLLTGWRWIAPIAAASNGYVEFDYLLSDHRALRIVGRDLLLEVTGGANDATNYADLDGEQLELLYDAVRYHLLADQGASTPPPPNQGPDYWIKLALEYKDRMDTAIRRGVGVTPVSQPLVAGLWRV